ncbi:dimethylarginine dimethylaminohydrolase family protein [Pseudoneobacillus rhizosphaerae]|jgi:dimethylargininase|uniref:N(G),N(G)-dimethylarginine dimethylaminohydrolase n=1 Tax=Pseudoneobacillus rhizosphaerae TaxID=2880968 RepID=A0A9C7G8M6_9BACI|nr:arginine deiminase family protein [Pseudoneobacillus rhizosphaerae]CAG9607859.1 N(G),N(G)-dimethylarginine dimethylaminohydrolase [Pseudoneobacillus rhizosphaerae]
MFKNTIVKTPGESYIHGLTTSDLGKPDYEKALQQHNAYIEALKKCAVEVHVLASNPEFPDSTFVEDTAVLTPGFAVISNPGAISRNREIIEMDPVLKSYYEKTYSIQSPGTLDGGDVLQIDDHFYIGISERTNLEGAQQLKQILEGENYKASIIQLEKFFHLKTGISYLGNQEIVVAGEFIDHPEFQSYKKIIVPAEEEYAANCIRVNDYVIIPAGFPKTKQKMNDAGYKTIELDVSEFRKLDGGLSCLSLRF